MSNWYLQNGKESDVAECTKVSLFRNIDGFKFGNKCSKEDKKKILELMENSDFGYGLKLLKLKDMDEVTKASLIEKYLISPEFANLENESSAILINNEENICIEINGEDHIHIMLFSEGIAIEELKNLAIEIDKKIEKIINYAYSEKYGYLTACPTNVGTGFKVSVMVHLPALCETKNIAKVVRIVNNFGMSAKNLYKEKLNADIFWISNNQTLGYTEDEIAKNVGTIIEKIIEQERTARKHLGKQGIGLENKVYRAYGLMAYSKIMEYNEFLGLMSLVKLGTDMGIIKELDDSKVKKLCLYTKPANMQKYFGQPIEDEEQAIKRAEIINTLIKN